MPRYQSFPFEGYTHRFIVTFSVDNDWRNDRRLDIYSDSGDRDELKMFIENRKTDKVLSFEITHIASKEQDERTNEFLNEILKDI